MHYLVRADKPVVESNYVFSREFVNLDPLLGIQNFLWLILLKKLFHNHSVLKCGHSTGYVNGMVSKSPIHTSCTPNFRLEKW